MNLRPGRYIISLRGDKMEIVRLGKNDYDEWLYVLNTVFSKHNNKEMDFEKSLPKMCVKDDYHMGMHLAIKDNGKICSLLGVYPIRMKIGESDLLFSTVGNVATLLLINSIGDKYPKHLRGLLLINETTESNCSCGRLRKSVPLGKKNRIKPFMFSLLPLCQGE